MKTFFAFLTALCIFAPAAAEEPLEAFLARARRGNASATYAKLDGVLQHRRRGRENVEMPIYFGVLIRPEKSSGQVILDGREGCLVGQSHLDGTGSLVAQSGSTALFDETGLQISDLTLGFIYFPVQKELDGTLVGGFVPCRVVLFSVPDRPGESVRVAFSKEYAFPLRAEFFRAGEKEPFRSVEVSGFSQQNGLYYARRILTEGPGWRTRIDFDRVELGVFDPGTPVQIMRPLPDQAARKGK